MADRTDSKEERIITIKDDYIYGYVNVIEKIMHRKTPFINSLLRRKPFEFGDYRIRNGQTKRLTQDEIKITGWKRVMWLNLTNEEAKQVLGIDNDESLLKDYGNYVRVLRKYFSKHEMSFMNIPFMYWHFICPIPKPVQQRLL